MFSIRHTALVIAVAVLSLPVADCGGSSSTTTQSHRQPVSKAATPAAKPQPTTDQYANVLRVCLREGDSRTECEEYVHRCRALKERPSACRENHVGRAQERTKEREHTQEARNAELESVHHEVEAIKENKREQRLIREREEAAARTCRNSPEQCERAEAEAHSRIKEIEEER